MSLPRFAVEIASFAFFAKPSCEPLEMRTIAAPPPSPVDEGPGEIWDSCTVEQTFERVQFDIDALIGTTLWNDSWKLCCLPTKQIKLYSSCWDQIKSLPGIYTAKESDDGAFHEVALNLSYIPWFHSSEFDLDLNYDPTEPADADVRVQGAYEAKRRAEARFLERAVKASRSGPQGLGTLGLRSCYIQIAELHGLQIPLEWAILNYDILESGFQVRHKFAYCLVFLGLNLLEIYDTSPALELLSNGQDELLQVFTDLSKTRSGESNSEEIQKVSLVRYLLEFSGGREDFSQHKFSQEYTAIDNANLCGSLIGIAGSNYFGKFNSQEMLNALSKSKVFTDDDFRKLKIVELSTQMTLFLPIGFPQGHLDLPAQVLYRLSSGQVDQIGRQIARIYHQRPSLDIPENNVLVLLAWSSTANDQPRKVLSEWAASHDCLTLYQRLTQDVQGSHTAEQLALIIAALLCYKRLLRYTPNDTTQSIKGSYLADFDALINGEPLSNVRVVFERMAFSLLQVLDTFIEDYQDICQLLATVLDAAKPILLEFFDGFSDQYWVRRKKKLDHKDALGCLIETTVWLDTNDEEGTNEEGWMMVPFSQPFLITENEY